MVTKIGNIYSESIGFTLPHHVMDGLGGNDFLYGYQGN